MLLFYNSEKKYPPINILNISRSATIKWCPCTVCFLKTTFRRILLHWFGWVYLNLLFDSVWNIRDLKSRNSCNSSKRYGLNISIYLKKKQLYKSILFLVKLILPISFLSLPIHYSSYTQLLLIIIILHLTLYAIQESFDKTENLSLNRRSALTRLCMCGQNK